MVNIVRQGDTDEYNVVQYTADTRADIQSLSTNTKPGSSCIVIEDSSVWMLNGSHIWKELV